MALPRAIKLSLEYEEKGLMFYLQMAKETKDPLGRRLFYSLSKEEIDHIMLFEKIGDSLKNNGKWPRLTIKGIGDVEGSIKDFFITLKKKRGRSKIDNIEGYKLALKLEQKSYDMYSKLEKESGSPATVKFFNALKGEEAKHIEAIENVLSYLTNYGDWIQAEESKTWNWMNM